MVIRKRKNEDDEDWDYYGIFDDFDEEIKRWESRLNKIWEELSKSNLSPDKSFVYGFTFKMGPDGKPEFQEFGNVPKGYGPKQLEYREPLTDVTEDDKNIYITVELPGIEKENIDIQLNEQSVVIDVNTPDRKYHKEVELSAKIKT
ncbi:MAG: Hsp20/alpha crystallin family protein, partial [Thermoplasmata archaeon]